MSVELITKFQPYVDEIFKAESKRSLLTNEDFSWTGAHTIKIYKISTAAMTDYGRTGPTSTNWSRYGAVASLNATTEEMTLKKDRSFTFAIDKLDTDETGQQLAGASALARQQREVIIPEIDSYVYGVMAAGAGNTKTETLTASNVYDAIITGTETLDDAEVNETGRVLLVSPATYRLMKQCGEIAMETDIGNDLRLKGVIAVVDGMNVIKVPSARLPEDFAFMIAHPVACVAPVKLEDYTVHSNPPGINGQLVEGRVCYDAFVLDNKEDAIYLHKNAAATG